jgi:hypothetical protein
MAETTMRLSDLRDFVGVQVDPASRADNVYSKRQLLHFMPTAC